MARSVLLCQVYAFQMLSETNSKKESEEGTGKRKLGMKKEAHVVWLNSRLSSTAGKRHSTPVDPLGELYFFGFLLRVFWDTTINIPPVHPAILWPLTFPLQLMDHLLGFLLLGPIQTLYLFNLAILSFQNLKRGGLMQWNCRIFSVNEPNFTS